MYTHTERRQFLSDKWKSFDNAKWSGAARRLLMCFQSNVKWRDVESGGAIRWISWVFPQKHPVCFPLPSLFFFHCASNKLQMMSWHLIRLHCLHIKNACRSSTSLFKMDKLNACVADGTSLPPPDNSTEAIKHFLFCDIDFFNWFFWPLVDRFESCKQIAILSMCIFMCHGAILHFHYFTKGA